ncbi:MAG: phosphoenolpyruvate--protein phosphotransferase [Candidatus Nanopelagicaceae bacterium]|nr:phosphoenolpyruvate--protein phosphotransferase [Candidatus Nanopelagicaceae bacterium]
MDALQGISASTGAALGPFQVMAAVLPKPSSIKSTVTPMQERENLHHAAKTISDELVSRAARTSGEAQEILEASSEIAQDSALLSTAESLIDKGYGAAYAMWEASEVFAQLLTEAGGYLAERASDVANIRDRIICVLSGVDYPEIPHLDYPFVLIARDLSPADTTDLKPGQVLAIVTEEGGPTSHTAIIARTLAIPAVVACKGVVDAAKKDLSGKVGVDARGGLVTFDPTLELETELAALTASITVRRSKRAVRGRNGYETTDGIPIPIYANIGRLSDIEVAINAGADGVGLLRTELLYLDRQTPPTLDEQSDIYIKAFTPFAGKKVVIRTLDAGADKPMAFINFADEPNPALGVRGYRTIAINKELLTTQLQAIADAIKVTSADVWVMAPMITLPEEAENFVALAKSIGIKTAGVMIEVPAAVLLVDEITSVSNFVSIGTNDLGQYLHAADRESAALAHFNDPWQPALLNAVHRVAISGSANNCPVGVCGEAASDPTLAAVLIGLGVTSLSCNVSTIEDIAIAMTNLSHLEMREAANAALHARNAKDARDFAREHLPTLVSLGL